MKRLAWVVLFLCIAAVASAQDPLIYPPSWIPPACNGIFVDVPCPPTPEFPYSDYIEAMFNEGITVGTQREGDPLAYSPWLPTPRAQDAAFVMKIEHSILERFATGGFQCTAGQVPTWAKCQTAVNNPNVHANSTVMLTYTTRGDDTQIPPRIIEVHEGGFSAEIQTNQFADYLSFTP